MFRKLVIPLAILGVILLLGLFVFVKNSLEKKGSLILIKENDEVSYKEPGKEYVAATGEETNIPNGSFVKTGGEGLAHVILPDDSLISLSRNTELQINFNESKTSISQTLGNVWYRVQKLAGRSFEVETPTTVAAVRGTIFGAEIGEEDTVYVTDGEIDVSQVEKEEDKKVIKNTQKMTTGKLAKVAKAAVRAINQEEIVDIPQEKKDTVWFRANELLNEEFRVGKPREFLKRLRESEKYKAIKREILENFRSSQVFSATDDLSSQFLQSLQNGQFENKELCVYINSADFETGMQSLRQSGGFLGGWVDKLIENIKVLKMACSDGIIDLRESEELQKLYQDIPTSP